MSVIPAAIYASLITLAETGIALSVRAWPRKGAALICPSVLAVALGKWFAKKAGTFAPHLSR